MTVVVDVQYAQEELPATEDEIPSPREFERWVSAALAGCDESGELTVRIVGESEGAVLNETYRRRSGATNVLSFPIDSLPKLEVPLLGDVVICAPLVVREAGEQHKSVIAHWAHLTVHGVLHLLGYDHEEHDEAEIMECLEKEILASLGFPDPYAAEKLTQAAY